MPSDRWYYIFYSLYHFYSFLFVINDGPSVKDQIKNVLFMAWSLTLARWCDNATLDTPALRLVVN